METKKVNIVKKTTKIKTRENGPKRPFTEVLREILIGPKEGGMEISENTKEVNIEQRSK